MVNTSSPWLNMRLSKLERSMIRSGWQNEYGPFHGCKGAILCLHKRVVPGHGPWPQPKPGLMHSFKPTRPKIISCCAMLGSCFFHVLDWPTIPTQSKEWKEGPTRPYIIVLNVDTKEQRATWSLAAQAEAARGLWHRHNSACKKMDWDSFDNRVLVFNDQCNHLD